MELEPIKVLRELDEETGEVLYAVEHPEEMMFVEVVGALAMAQHAILAGDYDGQA